MNSGLCLVVVAMVTLLGRPALDPRSGARRMKASVGEAATADVMKYGPNSEQVEAYLRQVAELDADAWASLAQVSKESTAPPDAVVQAIETARSRARRNGLLSEVDAAGREAHQAIYGILDASTALAETIDRSLAPIGPDDPTLKVALQGAEVTALRTAATAAASLLVLRPLLTDDEFNRAWPMHIIDPRSLPHHVYVPFIGATGC